MAKVNLAMLAAGVIDLKSVSERDFQRAIWVYAEQNGWKCYYQTRPARQLKDGSWRGLAIAGWPDVVAVRDGRMVAIECKSERGTATPEQREWVSLLQAIPGVSAGVFKPRQAQELMEALR